MMKSYDLVGVADGSHLAGTCEAPSRAHGTSLATGRRRGHAAIKRQSVEAYRQWAGQPGLLSAPCQSRPDQGCRQSSESELCTTGRPRAAADEQVAAGAQRCSDQAKSSRSSAGV